jgi:hypothetical protein
VGTSVLVEAAPVHELHRVVDTPVGKSSHVVDRDDAGVLQAGQDTRLTDHSRPSVLVEARHAQDLERDVPIENPISRPIHLSHAALGDRLQHLVASSRKIRPVGNLPKMSHRFVG